MASLLRASGNLFAPAAGPLDESSTWPAGKPLGASKIWGSSSKLAAAKSTHLRAFGVAKRTILRIQASKEPSALKRELKGSERERLVGTDHGLDPFQDLKHRFESFKLQNFVENRVHYENLSQGQAPKFMVIACADSRVCPSNVLGFKPGEAFTVRNVANLVPPLQHGASETSAALEFAVKSLEVANILIVGHSRCGGIQALMSMKDEADSRSFIKDWVSIGKSARLSTKAAAGNLSFEKQCRHCEKESINASLLNLLTYPWIEKRVSDGTLSLHGGYYDFVNCTFEKWTFVYREGLEGGSKYAIKHHSLWS